MPANMYDDSGPDEGSATAVAESPEKETGEEGKPKFQALIDSAICPGMKPGEEMVVHIDKVMDKQYLVSYAPEPGDEEEEEEGGGGEGYGGPPESGNENPGGMYD